VFSGTQSVVTGDYLVVEIGMYPTRGETFRIALEHFSLRINGKKQTLAAQTPGFVAASVKYADWERRPTLVGSAGSGDAGVIIGRPRQTERFPGDPRPRQERLPDPPKIPGHEDRSGVEKEPPKTPADMINEEALIDGDYSVPVRGYLYFPFKGKPRSLTAVDLEYQGPAGKATLKLK
jgi:hypothetical protein